MRAELLAPAGDLRCLEAAFRYGADAAYIGGPSLQLRAAKAGFTAENVLDAVAYTHARGKKLYIAANSFLEQDDIASARSYADFLKDCAPDGVIASDMGMVAILRERAPELPIHISTQANCQNAEASKVWRSLGASRIVLGRECTLDNIREIRSALGDAPELECFIHGAMCMSYSGRCLLSAYLANRSANRGGCTQPCRWNYVLEEETRPGMYFPVEEDSRGTAILSSHDLCAVSFLQELEDAGAASFKIEGRMKSEYYVATVVNAYRGVMDGRMSIERAKTELDCVTHRPYSTGFYYSELKYGHDNRGEYLADCTFAAYVIDVSGTNALVEQRGIFGKGDTLELLSPVSGIVSFAVEQLAEDSGLSCDQARKSGTRYRMNVPAGTQPGDILRIRTKGEALCVK